MHALASIPYALATVSTISSVTPSRPSVIFVVLGRMCMHALVTKHILLSCRFQENSKERFVSDH